MRYFLELQYDGGAYCGWQRQNGQPSVQQTIEEKLSLLLGVYTEITGAGRTDTGVHAAYYVAHFETERMVDEPQQVVYKLNRMLPADIAIRSLTPVADTAHARFDACEREYRYYIAPQKNPFTRHAAWQYAVPLDIEAMNRAAEVLLSESDFTTFAKLNSNNKTNICRVMVARWEVLADGRLCFTIRADRFLRNMVRAIVGTLVDVGRGRYSVDEFVAIVRSRDLSRASGGAPAEGLFLHDVRYPATIFERKPFLFF
ncbi:MAG: tRNA pseudouridine(38-40) synthase TruA [Alistipes sp.]|nr:tRNA pseudouridine(38-40) synthase TruA [Alistipes sp.]